MKFGDTLYQRSVPKWAAYNFKYNELKHLIKTRTSAGFAVPLDIPAQGKSRWQELDNQLLRLLQGEYDNVTLFLRSKQGEIDRRVAHLEKQVKIAEHAVDENHLDRPILQARKYQRLVKDAEDISDDIQNLARFAAVQKTAFRKLLKKYRKWTGSTDLQTRVDVEVFSSEKLRTDYSDYQAQITELSTILTDELAAPMLTGKSTNPSSERNRLSTQSLKKSIVGQINEAALRTPLAFDAAVLTIPYGEAAGSAIYWIHPDNLDEARTLLLKYMRDASTAPPRANSSLSIASQRRPSALSTSADDLTHAIFFDNAQRFVKDSSQSRPTRIALSAHWSQEPEAAVTLAGLSPSSAGSTILTIKTKDLSSALQRESSPPKQSYEVSAIRNYLTEHRDVKPLAEISSVRSRYFGITNSADVANWATLDSSLTVTPVDIAHLEDPTHHPNTGDAFPYAVLHIRWEFARTPAVVRTFDSSHLAERIYDFTLENMAIHTVQRHLPEPSWHCLLDKDIRKVPIAPGKNRSRLSSRANPSQTDMSGISSGPSSTDGIAASSIFSAPQRRLSSVTSDDHITSSEISDPFQPTTSPAIGRKKKRARLLLPKPDPPSQRYWNEFDDGDSDVNPDDRYAIYVDPDAPLFPGTETVSKTFAAMYASLSKGTSRAASWFPLGVKLWDNQSSPERAPLLGDQMFGNDDANGDGDSSGSDTDEFLIPRPHKPKSSWRTASHGSGSRSMYRPYQVLTPRQKALERTLCLFYGFLIAVSGILLAMSAVLLGTGRRKAVVEVDAGVVAGVIAAEACAVGAIVLIMLRKQRLSILHWGIVGASVATIVIVGVSLLALMFAEIHNAAERKSSAPGH
ncbi:uncharacterized protein A1O9_07509 [Exophiala aquamarina CBS 119918]|uniref:SPX domain-containing protein n=1 Tax=Exophiala aquamarina CBS 119918 TaxID=1182545 RepID=A0A072P740_9EURO|nr:uncharacterized protein A1O9_07509 [Exophiala aquamarina CBS 119918]KEF55929.1 hypothetical protein A1O9_07509 [Exophiala aquamarina CBS 119918]